MSDSRGKRERIEHLFCEAVQLQGSEMRSLFLEENCRGEPEMRHELEKLLTLHERAGKVDFLTERPLGPPPIRSGQRIGCYTILHSLGEGGFAEVFLAVQESPVKRRVALKILKAGMDSRQVLARFDAEKQALALMDHPSIAQVFDAGMTDSGRPYFAMEYVDGLSITRYCDDHDLKISARLELFARVCSAVHHAHQKGVIHRDLKPENILVTERDDQSVPKVIDFGIAKAIHQPLTDRTIVTQLYHLMGTPAYLSPEQTWGSGQDIDTRSDIYSLGVLIYELLTGRPPFETRDLVGSGLEGMADVIRQRPPLRPSLRVKAEEGKRLDDDSDRTLVGLGKIDPDLDWVVLKALEKDRDRRYSSAAALSDDVDRYLLGETVSAVAPSLVYAVRKFGARNRKWVFVIAALLMLLVGIGGVAGIQTLRVFRAEGEIRESRRETYVNDVKLAQVFLKGGQTSAAGERLRKYLPDRSVTDDMRGFAWHYLWDQVRGEYTRELVGHTNEVYCLDYSPDGELLLSGGKDERIILWELESGRILQEWLETGVYDSLAFSHDGRFFGVSTRHNQIRLWKRHGEDYVSYDSWTEPSEARIRFSPTEDLLGVRLSDGSLKLFNLISRKVIGSVPSREEGRVSGQGISFTPDGNYIANRATDTEVELIDIQNLSVARTFPVEASYGSGTIVVSPVGNLLVSIGYSSGAKVWNYSTGERIAPSKLVSMPWAAATFSQDGRSLFTAGRDQRIHLYDTQDFNLIRKIRGHQGLINTISFNPTKQQIASGGKNSGILIWDVSAPSASGLIMGDFQSRVDPVFVGPEEEVWVQNGRFEIAPGFVGIIHQEGFTRIDQATLITEELNHPISFDGFSEQDGWFVRLNSDSKANRVRAVPWRELEYYTLDGVDRRSVPLEFEGRCSSRVGLSVSRDLLALGNSSGEICLFNSQTGKQLAKQMAHDQPVWELSFSPSGNRLVSTQRPMHDAPMLPESEQASLWEIGKEKSFGARRFLDHPGSRPDTASFSHSGDRIALSGGDIVSIWNSETATLVDLLKGHRVGVFAVAFSPDDRIFASGGGDGVRLWDLETGLELLEIRHERTVTGLTFSPSGNALAFVAGPATLHADHIRIIRVPGNLR